MPSFCRTSTGCTDKYALSCSSTNSATSLVWLVLVNLTTTKWHPDWTLTDFTFYFVFSFLFQIIISVSYYTLLNGICVASNFARFIDASTFGQDVSTNQFCNFYWILCLQSITNNTILPLTTGSWIIRSCYLW